MQVGNRSECQEEKQNEEDGEQNHTDIAEDNTAILFGGQRDLRRAEDNVAVAKEEKNQPNDRSNEGSICVDCRENIDHDRIRDSHDCCREKTVYEIEKNMQQNRVADFPCIGIQIPKNEPDEESIEELFKISVRQTKNE